MIVQESDLNSAYAKTKIKTMEVDIDALWEVDLDVCPSMCSEGVDVDALWEVDLD